jgi:nitrate reductase gamma subunit
MYHINQRELVFQWKDRDMRQLASVLFGIGDVLIAVGLIIGFSILPTTMFHDESDIAAGTSIGGVVGLVLAIGLIIMIRYLRDKWMGSDSSR